MLSTPQATGDGVFYVEIAIEPPESVTFQPGMTAWIEIAAGETTWLRRLIEW